MYSVITVATLIFMQVSVIVIALVHPTRAQSVPQKNVCSWYVTDAVEQLEQLKAWHAEDLISADVLKERQQKVLDGIHRAPEGPLPDPNKAATQEGIATSCATSPIGLPTPEQWEQAQADLALLQQTAKNNYVELAECTLNTTKMELVVCERAFDQCNVQLMSHPDGFTATKEVRRMYVRSTDAAAMITNAQHWCQPD